MTDYPRCPDCETDLFVARYRGDPAWICHRCEQAFDGDGND